MALSSSQDLTTLASTITFNVDHDKSGLFSMQYKSGAGTLVVEGSCDGGTTWDALCFIKSNDTAATRVASATTTGLYEGTFGGIDRIRVRKSVGSAACVASFGITEY